MKGNVSGNFSTTGGMVSVPRVGEEEEKLSADNPELDMSGDITEDDMSEDGYYSDAPVYHVQPKQSLGQRISSVVSGGFGATSAAFTTVNTAISQALRVSPKVTSAFMSVALALCFATGGLFAYDWFNQPTPALWVGKDDCADHVAEAKTEDTNAFSELDDLEAAQTERAKKIYSVLKAYNPNLKNEHIAAVLANMDAESNIDETSIETVYVEAYQMGPVKKAFDADFYNKSEEALGKYTISLDLGFYHSPDGKCRVGIGLVQNTGPNAKQLIETAEGMGHKWYELEYQLAYLLAFGGPGDDKFFDKGHFDTKSGSLNELCNYVCQNIEGMNPGIVINGTTFGDTHSASAQKWLDAMSGWSVDESYANSVFALLEQMGGSAAVAEVQKRKSKCPECASEEEDNNIDNSGIAQAAATFAWPKGDQAYNNGTEIYQKVLPAVFNGDTYFKACDRVALSAVRWAGADDDFPSITGNQQPHMETSPLWDKVGASPSESQLQPGDVLIYNIGSGTGANGHVFIYTGHEVIEKVHGSQADSSANVVEGSLDTRSAGCVTYGDFGTYTAYRCVKPMNSDKYKNVVSGYTFSNGKGKSDNKNCNKKPVDNDAAHMACMIAYSQPAWYVPVGDRVGQNPGTNRYWYAGHNVKRSSEGWLNCEHACDNTVGTILRLSGVDSKVGGGLGSIWGCVGASWSSHPHYNDGGSTELGSDWEFVGKWKDLTEDDLEPGDVMVSGCHTCMYVGPDIPVEVYNEYLKGTDADLGAPDGVHDTWVSGHHGSNGWGGDSSTPCIGPASFAGPGWSGDHESEIYRCVKKDGLDTYVDVMDGYDESINYREKYAGDRAWSSVPSPLHVKKTGKG